MAKITTEEKKKREEILDKNKEVFDLLREVGGIFYLIDMAKFLGIKTDTLRYRLKQIEKIGFIDITNDEYNSTERSVIRLTRAGWYALGYSRGLVKINEDNIQKAVLKSAIYKRFMLDMKYTKNNKSYEFKSIDELNQNFFDALAKMIAVDPYEQRAYDYYKKVNLEEFIKKYKNKIVVYNYNLGINNKNKRLKICFYKTSLDIYEITEFCDMLLGLIEKAYNSAYNRQYNLEPFYFKISLSIVSYYPLYNKNELLTPLQNKKRSYHYYSKFGSREMYNYFKEYYKYINFFAFSKNESRIIKY